MQANFLDAHERHWDDAERLFAVERWANADHLYGVAAECGLKELMKKFGMKVSDDGAPSLRDDRQHANNIWKRFESYSKGHQGTSYVLPSNNPFDDWDVSDRYAHQSNFDQMRVQGHQIGAQAVRSLISKAKGDGLL